MMPIPCVRTQEQEASAAFDELSNCLELLGRESARSFSARERMSRRQAESPSERRPSPKILTGPTLSAIPANRANPIAAVGGAGNLHFSWPWVSSKTIAFSFAARP